MTLRTLSNLSELLFNLVYRLQAILSYNRCDVQSNNPNYCVCVHFPFLFSPWNDQQINVLHAIGSATKLQILQIISIHSIIITQQKGMYTQIQPLLVNPILRNTWNMDLNETFTFCITKNGLLPAEWNCMQILKPLISATLSCSKNFQFSQIKCWWLWYKEQNMQQY